MIVHTTVWIDYLGGLTSPHTSWLDRELTRQRLGLTDLILCAILQGIRDDATFTQAHQDFSKFQVFSTGGVDLAVASAQIQVRPAPGTEFRASSPRLLLYSNIYADA